MEYNTGNVWRNNIQYYKWSHIWYTNIDIDLTIFEITASNSIYIDSYNVSIIAQHLDTDLDGIPDYLDEDDDGDGWTDEVEELCGTDSLEFYDFPGDMDSDNLCDLLDDVDDSPILFFYPNDKIVATVGRSYTTNCTYNCPNRRIS